MTGLGELPFRLTHGLKRRLKSSPLFMRMYRGLLRNAHNKRFFTDTFLHERMLADHPRTETYYRAIQKHVKPGDVVVDLGTGTGILSFFAAFRDPQQIYALDHSDVIDKARLLARNNNIGCIEFLKLNSRRFRPSEPVDIIIHEQIGRHLFDENMVANLVDLRERILKPGGKILPSRFELFLEPVKLRDEERVPFLWEQEIHGVDYSSIREAVGETAEIDHRRRIVEPDDVDGLLCEPKCLLAFDLETIEPDGLPRTLHFRKQVVRDGRLDGFCLYFDIHFDETLSLSTSPMAPKTHWNNPLLRVESEPCRRGEWIEFDLTMEDPSAVDTWTWSHRKSPAGPDDAGT